MERRQRKSFVRIVDLGSFSRASALVRDIVREVVAGLIEVDASLGAALVGRPTRDRS